MFFGTLFKTVLDIAISEHLLKFHGRKVIYLLLFAPEIRLTRSNFDLSFAPISQ